MATVQTFYYNLLLQNIPFLYLRGGLCEIGKSGFGYWAPGVTAALIKIILRDTVETALWFGSGTVRRRSRLI